MVLGYFEVSAVNQKRIFITAHELDPLNLPQYKTDCIEYVKSPDDWPLASSMSHPPSWDEVYHMFMDTGDFTFVMPIVKPGTSVGAPVMKSNLLKLVFSTNVCALYEYSGFTTKPDFWVDVE